MSVTTNFQLAEICDKHNIPLVGVYSKNDLPDKPIDGGYIVNLSDSHDEHGRQLPGTHWVAFWVEKKKCCYFDSFGVPPPLAVQAFLKSMVRYPYSNITIQNLNSSVCGWYCIHFLVYMDRTRQMKSVDKRFTHFLNLFSYNPEHNRRMLNEYLNHHGISVTF
jgi:hypothetical protein